MYKSFECFGIEVYFSNGELNYTKYFKSLNDLVDYAYKLREAGLAHKFITANKYYNKIDEL